MAALFAANLPALAGQDTAPPLRWRAGVYLWHYNPQHQPPWLETAQMLELLQQAALAWRPCGIELRYGGITGQPPGTKDASNVIGWKTDGRNFSAWTHWWARRSGEALEADITLYANIFERYRRLGPARGIDAMTELRKSVIHEFGHVLGLGHSDRPGDAMRVRVRTLPDDRLPSDNDLTLCRALYPERQPGSTTAPAAPGLTP